MQPFRQCKGAGLGLPCRNLSGDPMTNIVLGTVAIVAAATFTITTADSASAELPQETQVAQH